MSVKVYKNGSFHELAGQKIFVNGQWRVLNNENRIYFNGQWHYLGKPDHHLMTTTHSGEFSLVLRAANPFTIYIDWGDGSFEFIALKKTGGDSITHTYSDSSAKEIRIFKSDCHKLSILNCNYNALTMLDPTLNINLESLSFNQRQTVIQDTVTSIDVSKNTALLSLNCTYGKLTELDVSKNTLLKSLNCTGNPLTMLDISKNPELETLHMQHAYFPAEVINNVLRYLVLFGKTNGHFYSHNQITKTPPTGQGLIDKQTLIDRGWIIFTD